MLTQTNVPRARVRFIVLSFGPVYPHPSPVSRSHRIRTPSLQEEHAQLAAAAKAAGVLVMVEVHKRFDPIYLDARDKIQDLGEFSYMYRWVKSGMCVCLVASRLLSPAIPCPSVIASPSPRAPFS